MIPCVPEPVEAPASVPKLKLVVPYVEFSIAAYCAPVVAGALNSWRHSTSSGLAMPVLPGVVGSSLTDEPIAERIDCIPARGPALPLLLLEALIDTTRSCAWAVDARAAQAIAATAFRMDILL